MKSTPTRLRKRAALAVLIVSFLLPYLCRLPRGLDWTAQYVPDESFRIVGFLFLGVFFLLPGLATAGAVLLSAKPFHLPAILACSTAFFLLVHWHHDNDLSVDAQAAISLPFISLYVAVLATLAGGLGFLIQWILSRAGVGSPSNPES